MHVDSDIQLINFMVGKDSWQSGCEGDRVRKLIV